MVEVRKEIIHKSPSQRLRSVIFLLWKQAGEELPFEVFYAQSMDKIIEHLKSQASTAKLAMIMDHQSARELAAKVIGTGNKGFLIVVFPENETELSMEDLDIATNANNDTVFMVAMLVSMMMKYGIYQQEILGKGQQRLPME